MCYNPQSSALNLSYEFCGFILFDFILFCLIFRANGVNKDSVFSWLITYKNTLANKHGSLQALALTLKHFEILL